MHFRSGQVHFTRSLSDRASRLKCQRRALHLNPIYSVCNYDGVVFVFCIFMYEYLFVN